LATFSRHRGLQCLVDAADPLLLDRHRVDRGDLQLGLRERAAPEACEQCHGQRGTQGMAA
jgi:hypothetical protein